MKHIEDAKNNQLNPKTRELVSNFFKALSDPTRIMIIYALKEKALTVTELTQALNMTQSAISHQLRTLKDNKIVNNEKKGKEVYYSLSDHHIYTIFDQAKEHMEESK